MAAPARPRESAASGREIWERLRADDSAARSDLANAFRDSPAQWLARDDLPSERRREVKKAEDRRRKRLQHREGQ